jgi:hypothetical protein
MFALSVFFSSAFNLFFEQLYSPKEEALELQTAGLLE